MNAPEKRFILLGGGELRTKETLKLDGYIAEQAKRHAGDKRAYGLFIPTASHDSMPYFNSFRKTYTSVYDIKADVALSVYGEMDFAKWQDKFSKADFLYVGGGDTLFMLDHWKRTGILDLVKDAYERGVIVCGLSAGAICWFERMYTDSPTALQADADVPYAMYPGLNWIKDTISPHYNVRALDFDEIIRYNKQDAIGLEDNAAVEYIDGKLVRSLSAGGRAYRLHAEEEKLEKQVICPELTL